LRIFSLPSRKPPGKRRKDEPDRNIRPFSRLRRATARTRRRAGRTHRTRRSGRDAARAAAAGPRRAGIRAPWFVGWTAAEGAGGESGIGLARKVRAVTRRARAAVESRCERARTRAVQPRAHARTRAGVAERRPPARARDAGVDSLPDSDFPLHGHLG